ncbi:Microtubule-actin cross-linking factor 1; isoforms 1/2/3/5 [Camelus dromedarius]|uniref:Microtubule-actin cross-linking factor 1 n=1 Tax=Camelus dromedarius TaxID=9838 RepID=A0A5N4CGG6_CAMDR|nr:Microtubule-actin cross-linking factor 1; isoforms 1/2/3/5 [Camelus dromedarius]
MAESNAERKENKPCEGKEARRGQPEGPSGPLPAGRSLGPARTRDLLGPLATRAVEVTEVTEVTETVVTEAVEVGPVQPGSQPALASPGPLDTTRSWLEGMEELQASQGPLAPDVTVAVAQLREQKLLRRLLEERALQVELRLQEAQSPGQLRARWDGLVQRAEARWGLLEQLVPAARSFEVAHSALLALLTPGEQLLAELWQDQLGPEGCKGAVQRLQGVCEGAAARTEGLERALEAGQRLAELLAGECHAATSAPKSVFRKEVELLGGCWSEAQKQDTRLKAIRGPVELAASEEGLQPEGSWAQALQVFPWELWGEWTLSASLLWREPALPGRATGRGTCHLGLLLEPQGCRAMASSSTTERPRVLEGTVMLAAPRFAEELLTLPTRLSQAEPHGPKPGPVARGCGRHSHLLDQAGVVMMALLPGVLRPPSLHQDSECPSDLQVSRGALMVRVGGGWVALDEYLVKYDPGRAKGRTNQKIHERFLSWAVAPSLPAPAVVPERLWASILCTTGSPLSRKVGARMGI